MVPTLSNSLNLYLKVWDEILSITGVDVDKWVDPFYWCFSWPLNSFCCFPCLTNFYFASSQSEAGQETLSRPVRLFFCVAHERAGSIVGSETRFCLKRPKLELQKTWIPRELSKKGAECRHSGKTHNNFGPTLKEKRLERCRFQTGNKSLRFKTKPAKDRWEESSSH